MKKLIPFFFVLALFNSCEQEQLSEHNHQHHTHTQVHQKKLDSKGIVKLSSLANNRSSMLMISSGMTVDIDTSIDVEMIMIAAGGQLRCNSSIADQNIEISVAHMMIEGEFNCGSEVNPYPKNLTISLKHNASGMTFGDPTKPHTQNADYRAIMVMGGKLRLFGKKDNSGWQRIAGTMSAGSNEVLIWKPSNGSFNWKSRQIARNGEVIYPGDEIIIGSSSFDYKEAEKFRIIGVDKNSYQNRIRLMLDRPANYQHYGENQFINTNAMGQIDINERAEIANLSRNIVIQAPEDYATLESKPHPYDDVGGHIMIMNKSGVKGVAKLDSLELRRMGQAGYMARYPFHWHLSGNVQGQYIKNSSIHDSFQRCIVVHGTNYALVQNNVCYNIKGHGIFLEDGNEIKNQITNNLVMSTIYPKESNLLLDSEHISSNQKGRFHAVSSFWISNPDNNVNWNTASGSEGTGFWNAFKDEVIKNGVVVARPAETATLKFWHNTAHANVVGMNWDGAEKNAPSAHPSIKINNPESKKIENNHYEPPTPPTFKGLRVYKNRLTGIYFRSNTNVIENLIAADNGWGVWNAYNNIIKDSVFIGRTDNSEASMYATFPKRRFESSGVILYDGPFEVHNTDFINYGDYSLELGRPFVPFTTIGGERKLTNLVSGLHFDPEPSLLVSYDKEGETRQALSVSMIRDLDGSLIGSPGLLTGIKSQGVLNDSNCQEADERFEDHYRCPTYYKEHTFALMSFPRSNPRNTIVARRLSDGKLNLDKDAWNDLSSMMNINFNVANNDNADYEVLSLKRPNPLAPPSGFSHHEVAMNSERLGSNPYFEMGVIRLKGYGNNCKLVNSAVPDFILRKSTVNALRQSPTSGYHSNGNQFYFKVVPTKQFLHIQSHPDQQAKAYSVDKGDRFRIECDGSPLTPRVIGRIDNVISNETTTTIRGWACNKFLPGSTTVQLFLGGPNNENGVHVASRISEQSAEAAVNFQCENLGLQGGRFQFIISNAQLNQHNGKYIHIKGLSLVPSQPHRFLNRSGVFRLNLP